MDIGRYKERVEEESNKPMQYFLVKVDFRSCGSESERTKAYQANARASRGTP